MPTTRPRPLLAVRLTGPANIVAAHKRHLIEHFAAVYGENHICRTSTRHADHVGEINAYLTVRPTEVSPR
ncbi:hypothetical protein [Paractinoplanes atraurantiacus]|uniref:Uncharacterized protein n=1 Tax=Paractinoplanes atraurantiacus TaxID=1036182 RepID=A0A285FEZ7_9ACTN|nr:hypothetical protein [Actinoplanes atraurantiacus]SNY09862.1 hypothetical protein SAMN05421748_101905 [Actinoplanes atraurantiacus]